jgi:hypothetical protein
LAILYDNLITNMLRKCFLLINTLVFLINSVASAQQYYTDISTFEKLSVFTETFENNYNNWITDNSYINGRITNGSLDVVCKNYKQSTGLTYKSVPIEYSNDFEIETSISIHRGTGAIVFGMNEKLDHYRVEITDKNLLVILKNTPSRKKIEKLLSPSINSSIKSGAYNIITIRKLKNTFFIFINETLVGQFIDLKPAGDLVGFNVGLDSEISVDYLKVSYLKDKNSPLFTEKSKTEQNSNQPSVISSNKNPNVSNGPLIVWVQPSGMITPLESYTAKIKANIKSNSGLKSVLLYLNGVSKGEAEPKSLAGENGIFIIEKTIDFSPGENNIYIVATNNEGSTKSEIRSFVNPNAILPVITWENPYSPTAMVNTGSFSIGVCIKSITDLKSIKILVNGDTQGGASAFQTSSAGDCNYRWQQPVILKEGDNSIFIIATNVAGSTTSERRSVRLLSTFAEKRIALVIGNSEYGNKTPLKNPANDANLMEATLKDLGFEVIKRINAGKDVMAAAIREFSQKLPGYNVGLFYYAGHGNQVDGINYMIPTDATLENKDACKYEAVRVDFLVDEFNKYPENTNIVILDACRDNPYKSWARGSAAGYKAMTCSSGTIIAYATSEGATAADGEGANGLYTEELVKQMAIPQPIESVFKRTRVQVRIRSNDKQIPTEYSFLNGDFYFVK